MLGKVQTAQEHDTPIRVSPVVVAETVRGLPGDAVVNRLLAQCEVPAVDESLARLAGRLLAGSGLSQATDALVMAEAMRSAPCVLLTSDAQDMQRLARGHRGVEIVPI
jgi:predicted nucleic acid-binding protein